MWYVLVSGHSWTTRVQVCKVCLSVNMSGPCEALSPPDPHMSFRSMNELLLYRMQRSVPRYHSLGHRSHSGRLTPLTQFLRSVRHVRCDAKCQTAAHVAVVADPHHTIPLNARCFCLLSPLDTQAGNAPTGRGSSPRRPTNLKGLHSARGTF
jgi:hypothetical protein